MAPQVITANIIYRGLLALKHVLNTPRYLDITDHNMDDMNCE